MNKHSCSHLQCLIIQEKSAWSLSYDDSPTYTWWIKCMTWPLILMLSSLGLVPCSKVTFASFWFVSKKLTRHKSESNIKHQLFNNNIFSNITSPWPRPFKIFTCWFFHFSRARSGLKVMVPKPIVMTFLGPSWLCFEIIAVDGWKSGQPVDTPLED